MHRASRRAAPLRTRDFSLPLRSASGRGLQPLMALRHGAVLPPSSSVQPRHYAMPAATSGFLKHWLAGRRRFRRRKPVRLRWRTNAPQPEVADCRSGTAPATVSFIRSDLLRDALCSEDFSRKQIPTARKTKSVIGFLARTNALHPCGDSFITSPQDWDSFSYRPAAGGETGRSPVNGQAVLPSRPSARLRCNRADVI